MATAAAAPVATAAVAMRPLYVFIAFAFAAVVFISRLMLNVGDCAFGVVVAAFVPPKLPKVLLDVDGFAAFAVEVFFVVDALGFGVLLKPLPKLPDELFASAKVEVSRMRKTSVLIHFIDFNLSSTKELMVIFTILI